MRKAISEEKQSLIKKSYLDCAPSLAPMDLMISITTSCNSRCAYCYHQEKTGSLLTFERLSEFIGEICAWGIPQRLCLSGGEATIWPGFQSLIRHAAKCKIKTIELCTNGLRFRDYGFLEETIRAGVNRINISIDTLDPRKFKRLRSFEMRLFKEAFSNCIKVRKKFPAISFSLVSVMSKEIKPLDLLGVKLFALRHGIGHFIQTFSDTPDESVNRRFALSEKERGDYSRWLVWLRGSLARAVRRKDSPFTRSCGRLECYQAVTSVKLLSDGSVKFCWSSATIGNMLEESFMDIWTSDEARRSREIIRDGKCDCNFDCAICEGLALHKIVNAD